MPNVHIVKRDDMESIGVKELRNNLSRILRMVEEGKTIRVMRHGKTVVELRPVGANMLHNMIKRLKERDLSEGGTGVIGPIQSVKNRKPGTQISDYISEDRR